MTKKYNGIEFSSQIGLSYYKEMLEKDFVLTIYTNIKYPLSKKYGGYYPMFIIEYNNHYEIIDVRSYANSSNSKAVTISNEIKEKTPQELRDYVSNNIGFECGKPCIYRKLRYIKTLGFVDFNFNANEAKKEKKKEEDKTLREELKELRAKVREFDKFINLMNKGDKLKRDEKRWLNEFKDNHNCKFIKRRKIDEN